MNQATPDLSKTLTSGVREIVATLLTAKNFDPNPAFMGRKEEEECE